MTKQRLQYIDPHSYGHQRCVFLFLQGCSIGGPEAHSAGFGLSLPHLVTNGSPNSIGGPEGPFGRVCLSLPHHVSNSSYLQLPDFLSSPSYIIVQSPTQSPTQFWEWHVWSSSSGNNCHANQRSLSSGASVYECIMGFYLVPFRQPNPPTRFLSITGHWDVSLPSGASLWKGMFGRVEGQNITRPHEHLWTPSHRHASVGRLARTYQPQLCTDTGCSLEDLPEAMDDRDGWRKRVSEMMMIYVLIVKCFTRYSFELSEFESYSYYHS